MTAKELKTMLTMFSKIKLTNPAIPVCENIHFSHGIATVTNLMESLTCILPDFDDTFCINFKMLKEFVGKIPKVLQDHPVLFEVKAEGSQAIVTCGTSKITISGDFPGDFPKVPEVLGGEEAILPAELMANLVKVADYCSGDELRPAMTGIYFDEKNAVTTDDTWLRTHAHGLEIRKPFIIRPNKTLFKAIKEDTELTYNVQNAKIDWTNYTYTTRLIDEVFPDYVNVIPTDQPITMHFERDALLTCLQICDLAANKVTHQVILSAEKDSELAVLTSEDLDFSTESREEIPVMYLAKDEIFKRTNSEDEEFEETVEYPSIKIGFNAQRMIQVVKDNPKGDNTVTITAEAPNRAMRIDEDILLMPVMLGNYV